MAYASATTSLTAHADGDGGTVTVTGNTSVLDAWGSTGVITALAQSAIDMLGSGGDVGRLLEKTAGSRKYAIEQDGK